MAKKGETIIIKNNGSAHFNYKDWSILQGETLEVPVEDFEFLVGTQQDGDLQIVKE